MLVCVYNFFVARQFTITMLAVIFEKKRQGFKYFLLGFSVVHIDTLSIYVYVFIKKKLSYILLNPRHS